MSLADLVPIAMNHYPRRDSRGRFLPSFHKLTATQRHLRWVAKNRDRYNASRRKWYAERKAK